MLTAVPQGLAFVWATYASRRQRRRGQHNNMTAIPTKEKEDNRAVRTESCERPFSAVHLYDLNTRYFRIFPF